MPITTTPSGGPQGEFSTYTPIYSQTLSSTASSITFSNIPQTYTDLQLVCQTLASSSALNLTVNVNGDTATNYSITSLYARSEGAGTGVSSIRATNTTYALANYGTATTTNARSVSHVDFLDYSNSTTFKPIIVRASTASGNTTFSGNEIIANQWRSLAAITSITLGGGTFASGSTFTLYGIKAAVGAPKATGGDLVYSDSAYWYHIFNTTGSFTPVTSLTCDYLVVAGGGGSGQGTGGGGGAGGYRTSIGVGQTTLSSGTSYAVTIGAGGTGGAAGTQTNGASSSFVISGGTTITSAGGGRGGTFQFASAAGGSGGGGGYYQSGATTGPGAAGNTPSTSPSQGNNGGDGREGDPNYGSGGGGGAGAAGGSANTSQSGNGGAGALSSITGLYYAGGGGGGADSSRVNVAGTGGIGGGGNGATSSNVGNAGTANTGGGAGGGGAGRGNNGGSGVVVVRYLA